MATEVSQQSNDRYANKLQALLLYMHGTDSLSTSSPTLARGAVNVVAHDKSNTSARLRCTLAFLIRPWRNATSKQTVACSGDPLSP
jgi:hypothetical protein